ncbi:MAG: S9 family peptidase [Planctomycetes bacterium]|nr:S9 family peptidase [Planctomycetota bacterium]
MRPFALPLVGTLAATLGLVACASDPHTSGGAGSGGSASVDDSIPAPRAPVATRPVPRLDRKHPLSVHDLIRFERVGAPVPSPDGRWILHTRQSYDADANQKSTHLWLVSGDGSVNKQLTTAKGVADYGAAWSPDGRALLFSSSRDGGGKVWLLRLDGGEPRKFLELPVDVDNLRLSADGKHLAFSAEVYPGMTPAETAKRDAELAKDPVKARSYESLMVRHWDTWEDGKRSHLFVQPLEWDADGNPSLAGDARDLMEELDADCPTKPFGGAEDYVFSPDGSEIAYVAHVGADRAWTTDLDVYVVPVAGGESKCVTDAYRGSDKAPAYSPDGSQLLWLSMARPGFEADRQVIHVQDRASGAVRTIAGDWDRSVGSALWTPDGRTLLVTAEEEARQRVFALDVASGAVRTLLTEHWNDGLALIPAHGNEPVRLAFLNDSFTAPAELFRCELDGAARLRLTRVNDARLDVVEMSEPQDFWFKGWNDEKVHAWVAPPVGFEAGKKYPVAFVIHGGPQGAIGDHFHYRWNLNAFAGAGYAVVAVNFHGSTGFGQAFTDSISGDWGGKPFEDLMLGLDAVLAAHDWMDGERVGALGASYGGWMINWINGHTDRFKALVCHDGGFDEAVNYYTTEELWFPEWEFKGTPWQNPELFEKFSPSRHVADWKTPQLVIHGANDFRLIDAEGLAAFTALQRRGIPSKYLWFPDENHWVLKPKNSVRWHDTVIEWLDRWLLQ